MRLKTPSFWYKPSFRGNCLAVLLLPFSIFYRLAHRINQKMINTCKPTIPVICIGNLTAGGSGKTPVSIALMEMIAENSLARNSCFLTRGYGGKLKGPVFVDSKKHSYHDTGDEPLLLARQAATIVSANRRAGAMTAQEQGHDLIIMDDGLQNPSLEKTLSLVVIDGRTGFGNTHILPAGPLREKLAAGFAKADAFILIGEDRKNIIEQLPEGKPIFRARLVPGAWSPKAEPYVAFCGLGQPDKFKDTIASEYLNLAGWHVFPDHHRYTDADLKKIDEEARQKNSRLLTTEKDAVRLPSSYSFKSFLDILPVRIVWEDEKAVLVLLRDKLDR